MCTTNRLLIVCVVFVVDSQLIDSTLFEDSQMKDDINVAELPNEQIKDNEIIKQACDASMDISCAKAVSLHCH